MPATSHQELFQVGFRGDYALRQLFRQYILSKPPQANLDVSTDSKLGGGQVSINSEGENPQTGSTHCQAPPHTSPDLLEAVFLEVLSLSPGPAGVPTVQR